MSGVLARERPVALSRLGQVGVAVEAGTLVEILALDSGADALPEGAVDVALALGLPPPPGRRHLLQFRSPELGAQFLLLGEWISIHAVPGDGVRPWPPFLEGLRHRSGLEGYLEEGDETFFVLQLSALSRPAPRK